MNVDFDISANVSESSDSVSSSDSGLLGRMRQVWDHIHIFPERGNSGHSKEVGRSAGAQFQELSSRLEQDKKDLDQVARDVEERFLAMGTCVQELATLSNSLLTQSERLACTSGTEFKAHLQGALDMIRQQLDFAGQCQEGNAQLIGRLENYISQFQRLCDCEADLSKILTPMQTVSVLFKIHSVSLENEEKSFFATLTDQIVALQIQARTTFGEQMQGLLATGQSLSSSLPHLKEQSLSQGEKVRQKKRCIENSMEALQKQFDQMQSSHGQLSECGKKLKSASGGAVMGLQYQDITRQKWEHVATAVLEMCGRAKSPQAKGAKCMPVEDLAFLRDVSRIQIRQLQAIQSDLAQSQSAVSESIHAMLEQLRGMDAECQKMCGQSEGSTAIEAMVKVLLEALAETHVWVSDLAAMARTTSSAVSSFDKTASDVSGTLRRLSGSIGMIAINAQVQVARIDHENGLDVLSESICVAANEIKKFSETVGTELDGLVAELHQTIQDCRKLEEKTQEQQRWFGEVGCQMHGQLYACRDGTLSVQHEVKVSLEKIHEQAASTLGHADFHKASHEGFKRLQATLEKCASVAETSLGSDIASAVPDHVHALKKHYTMESEREVFEASVAERGVTSRCAEPVIPEKKGAGSEKRVVRDINPPQPVAAPAPKAIETPEATRVAKVPADPEKEPQVAEVAPADKKPDFGDNVELF